MLLSFNHFDLDKFSLLIGCWKVESQFVTNVGLHDCLKYTSVLRDVRLARTSISSRVSRHYVKHPQASQS